MEQDAAGGAYSATGRANFTLVELREMEFHAALDERGLRWQKDKRNELFQPQKSIDELIQALRTGLRRKATSGWGDALHAARP